MNQPTLDQVSRLLSYDPITGILTWLDDCHKHKLGQIAGYKAKHGYIVVNLFANGKRSGYYAHRIAWLLVTGEWPSKHIDHIDMDGTNNKWNNLRLATRTQNKGNMQAYKNNSSGYKGVIRWNGKWRAKVQKNGKQVHAGTFDTPEQASEAYLKKARELYGEFARR